MARLSMLRTTRPVVDSRIFLHRKTARFVAPPAPRLRYRETVAHCRAEVAGRFPAPPFLRCAESVAPYRAEPTPRLYPRETALLRCDALALSVRVALERIVPALARAAAAFVDAGAWRSFGYARAGDHARERFGRSGRWLRDLAALGAAFEKLPGLADAVVSTDARAGAGRSIGRVAASIIASVAASESLEAWVDVARAVPVRALRELAARARREGSVWPPRETATSLAGQNGEFPDRAGNGTKQPDVFQAAAVDSLEMMHAGGNATASLRPATDAAADEASTPPVNADAEGAGHRHERSRPRAVASAAGPTCAPDSDPNDTTDDDAPRGVLVRLMVPAPVAAAFDEALDLYRALAGSQTTVTEFVESLVADAEAGPHPVDAHSAPLGTGHPSDDGLIRALREKALARSTGNWKHLSNDAAAAPDWAFALAGMSLAALEEVCSRAGTGGHVELDTQIRALIRLEDELERRLARLLADMADQNAWARLRFDSLGHYAEQRLGMSRSAAQDRVRAQRGLSRLPIVNKAYQRGDIGLDAALTLVRILERGGPAGEEKQRAWVRRAQEASAKRLRDEERLMGRLRGIGSRPGAAGMLVDVQGAHGTADVNDIPNVRGAADAGKSAAYCGGAHGGERGAHDMPPDDDAWQHSLRREPGTARRRIAAFGRVALEDPQTGTFFRLRLPADLAAGFLSCVESARARLARVVEEVPWDQPWPGETEPDAAIPASLLCARMFSIRCRRSPAWVGLLALLEEFAATWDDPQMSPRRPSDAVYIRVGWRCTAPGCTSRRNLENHHIVYRSRGGSDELFNRTCLCRFHHQLGEHGGLSSCSGEAPLGVLWTLGIMGAKGGAGGRWRNEIRMP